MKCPYCGVDHSDVEMCDLGEALERDLEAFAERQRAERAARRDVEPSDPLALAVQDLEE